MEIKNITKYKKGRKERAVFVYEEFPILRNAKTVLDVGCDENYLKHILGESVTGIDITGNPDQYIDLENDKLKKFENNSFDVIVCTEVLEHLTNFHEMLDELVRVAQGYVVISLPNSTSTDRLISIIRRHRSGKHYGLPLEPKQDRHKWFFSYKEVIEFFELYAKQSDVVIDQVVLHHNLSLRGKTSVAYFFRRLLLSILRNVFRSQNTCESIYIVLKVHSSAKPS